MYAPHFFNCHPSNSHRGPGHPRKPNFWERRRKLQVDLLRVENKSSTLEEPPEVFDLPLNTFEVPGFLPNRITEEMERVLESEGGYLDQCFLYWEHQNAKAWAHLTEQKEYLPQHGFPYQQVSQSIVSCLKNSLKASNNKIEILAIGPGNGKKELHLSQELVETIPNLNHMLINLLDISQPLLTESRNNAETIFSGDSRVKAWGLRGNMEDLPQYYPLRFLKMKPRPRVITLIGGILGNLPNESFFIRNITRAFNKGDLLVIEVSGIYAASDDPKNIEIKDPRLNGRLPKLWNDRIERLLKGPFERHYGRRLQDIAITPVLDTSSNCIEGSYAVNMLADLLLKDQTTKQFIVQRFVRYEPNALIHMFEQLNWSIIDAWRFGKQKDYLLFLFQKC